MQTPAVITNADVVNMVAAGLADPLIMNAIRQAERRRFDLSPTALIDLKKQHVSDAVIAEMQKTASAVPPVPSPGSGPAGSLTREQAVDLIGRSPLFTSSETVVVKQALSCGPAGPYEAAAGESDADYFHRMQAELTNPSIPQARDIQGAGLQALRAAGLLKTRPSAGCGVDARRGVLQGSVTVLTPEGISASNQWRKVDTNTWSVPIARRSVVAVTGIKGDAQAAAVEFSWRWESAQTGVATTRRTLAAQALFEKYDDGWRLNTSRLQDYFHDGFGRVIFPPAFSLPAAPTGAAADGPSGAEVSQEPLAGKWSGGPSRLWLGYLMDWELSQEGTAITGRVTLSAGGGFSAKGSVVGTAAGPSMSFTMTVPKGALPNCEGVSVSGSANVLSDQIAATYAGTICGKRSNNGRLALSRSK